MPSFYSVGTVLYSNGFGGEGTRGTNHFQVVVGVGWGGGGDATPHTSSGHTCDYVFIIFECHK